LTLDFLSGHPTCEKFSDGKMQPFTPNRYTRRMKKPLESDV